MYVYKQAEGRRQERREGRGREDGGREDGREGEKGRKGGRREGRGKDGRRGRINTFSKTSRSLIQGVSLNPFSRSIFVLVLLWDGSLEEPIPVTR